MAKKKMTFAGAMTKAPKKAWEAARNAEVGGKRELPVIEDGNYPCRVKNAKGGVDSKDVPYVSYKLVVLEGEFEGITLDKFHSLKDWDIDLERLVKSLKGMGYTGFEEVGADKMGAFIENILADINESEPEVMVGVKNGTYTAKSDGENHKKGEEVPKLDIYVNRPRSVEEGAGTTAPPKKTAKKAPAKKTTRK
jgi:hypothetical protein